MGIIGTVLIGVLVKILADELKAHLPSASRKILKVAVAALPERLRERYSEEWAADLISYAGDVTRVIRAIGLCFASFGIRHQQPDNQPLAFVLRLIIPIAVMFSRLLEPVLKVLGFVILLPVLLTGNLRKFANAAAIIILAGDYILSFPTFLADKYLPRKEP